MLKAENEMFDASATNAEKMPTVKLPSKKHMLHPCNANITTLERLLKTCPSRISSNHKQTGVCFARTMTLL